ncbi:MAG TPA: c-type cytochrome [Casimicrobiaceae bacterium]|nr:c-type cytochrome [Casimicrobiaceae bacterium]
MKGSIIAAVAGAAFAAAVSAPALADDAGEKLAKDKGCTACHGIDKKIVGPAYKDVAKKYKGDAAAPAKLAEKVVKGGSGVWGPIPMPPNKVTDDEAKKLVAWVLSL